MEENEEMLQKQRWEERWRLAIESEDVEYLLIILILPLEAKNSKEPVFEFGVPPLHILEKMRVRVIDEVSKSRKRLRGKRIFCVISGALRIGLLLWLMVEEVLANLMITLIGPCILIIADIINISLSLLSEKTLKKNLLCFKITS